MASVKPRHNGKSRAARVTGKKAAETLLAASGVPQPFQRSRQGHEPSSQARRIASVHGAIWVTMSFMYGL